MERGADTVTELFQTTNACRETQQLATGDEFRGREGKNPDPRLRSSSPYSVGNEVLVSRQPGGWLRSSHP